MRRNNNDSDTDLKSWYRARRWFICIIAATKEWRDFHRHTYMHKHYRGSCIDSSNILIVERLQL